MGGPGACEGPRAPRAVCGPTRAACPRGMSLEQEGAERRRRDARESSAMHNEGKGQMSRTRSARGAWARAAMLSLLAVLVAHAATVSACTTAADCDDGNACTTDSCDAGACAYATIADCVPCTTAADCDDGNACTTDSCDAGACAYATIADCVPCTTAADCDDRNPCTTDPCSANGVCEH